MSRLSRSRILKPPQTGRAFHTLALASALLVILTAPIAATRGEPPGKRTSRAGRRPAVRRPITDVLFAAPD